MILQIHGCSTRNKGAELMAVAVKRHFEAVAPETRLAVTAWFGSYEQRAAYGLLNKLGATKFGRSSLAIRLMPRSFRRAYGLVNESDIDAVIDASGFAFGDQHGPEPTERFATSVMRWKKQDKKIVLLPQAFGPFTSGRIRTAMRQVVERADLVFAREEVSYQHIVEIAGDRPNVKQSPDFTNLVKGTPPEDFHTERRRACIVPNHRMIEKADASDAERYVPFLASCIATLRRRRIEPFLLLHDAESDEPLVGPIQEAAGAELPVVRHDDPVALKGILGAVHLVVGSRFHALVGGLSQAVSCIATGWSHKYRMLFEDYGCPELVLPVTASDAEIDEAVDTATEEQSRSPLVSKLTQAGRKRVAETRRMWGEVDRVLHMGSHTK